MNQQKSEEILAKLFRCICKELGLTREQYILYVRSLAQRKGVKSRIELTRLLTSVRREFFRDRISWKTFMRALIFFNLKRIKIIFDCSDFTVEHSIDLSSFGDIDFAAVKDGKRNETFQFGRELKRLFDKILSEKFPDQEIWKQRIDDYVDSISDSKKRQSDKGNLFKEVKRKTMTWKVFTKLLKIFGVMEFNFYVEMEPKVGTPRSAGIYVTL